MHHIPKTVLEPKVRQITRVDDLQLPARTPQAADLLLQQS
jgi:hypothetical protein